MPGASLVSSTLSLENKSRSLHFGLQPLFLVFWGALALVGNHARHRRRDSRFSRHAPRLFSHVDHLFLSALHGVERLAQSRRGTKQFIPGSSHLKVARPWGRHSIRLLKVEQALQINQAVGRRRGKRSANQAVGFAEQRRTEIANGIGHIHVIENVSRVDAKRQIVAII